MIEHIAAQKEIYDDDSGVDDDNDDENEDEVSPERHSILVVEFLSIENSLFQAHCDIRGFKCYRGVHRSENTLALEDNRQINII